MVNSYLEIVHRLLSEAVRNETLCDNRNPELLNVLLVKDSHDVERSKKIPLFCVQSRSLYFNMLKGYTKKNKPYYRKNYST